MERVIFFAPGKMNFRASVRERGGGFALPGDEDDKVECASGELVIFFCFHANSSFLFIFCVNVARSNFANQIGFENFWVVKKKWILFELLFSLLLKM